MNNIMSEIQNLFNEQANWFNEQANWFNQLAGQAEARKADQSNAVVNAYLAANPDAAKTLLDRAKAWNTTAVSRGLAEAKVRSCDAKIAKIQAAIAADRDMIASWTKQINTAKGEILCHQKALKEAESEAAKAHAELNALG